MKRVEFYQWTVDSQTPPGKRIRTRYKMDEATALARGGNPVKVEGSMEIRQLPEPHELQGNFKSGAFGGFDMPR